MKELLDYIVSSLVDDTEQVKVIQNRRGSEINLQVHVAKEDMGRVIGKNGRVANAMRVLLNVTAVQQNRRVSMDIEEPED